MRPLGKHQLELLAGLACPGRALIVPGKVSESLVRRGLLKCYDDGSFSCITPNGLRALADALEAGKVDDAHVGIEKDKTRRKAA